MDNNFKMIVAQNIFYLRTQNQMTQLELGEKLNYSDKAISKWERGDGIPDAFVLKKMSELFGVTVDYILTEHNEQERKVDTKPSRIAKAMLANVIMIGIATVALLVYIILAVWEYNKTAVNVSQQAVFVNRPLWIQENITIKRRKTIIYNENI